MKQILFVLHDAQRGGAQLRLLHFLQWFKKCHTESFSLLLEQGGPLAEEFQQLGPVYYWSDQSALEPILSDVKLIVGQTARSAFLLSTLQKKISCPRILCVCELSHLIRHLQVGHLLTPQLVDRYIAVSGAVQENLSRNHGIPEDHITVVHNGIPIPDISAVDQARIRNDIRAHLNIPREAPLVVSVGTMEWHKGPDILLTTARYLQDTTTHQIHFVWIGEAPDKEYRYRLQYDMDKLGLTNIHIVGPRSNVLHYLIAGDIFALVSREEALSNAMLEAASVGKSILCFDKAGGPSEFVADDAGIIVPYLDVKTLAETIVTLATIPDTRTVLGTKAAAKVRARHNLELVGAQYLSVFERVLAQTNVPSK